MHHGQCFEYADQMACQQVIEKWESRVIELRVAYEALPQPPDGKKEFDDPMCEDAINRRAAVDQYQREMFQVVKYIFEARSAAGTARADAALLAQCKGEALDPDRRRKLSGYEGVLQHPPVPR